MNIDLLLPYNISQNITASIHESISQLDYNIYIYHGLINSHIRYEQDARLLLAIHDTEVCAAIPDRNQLVIYTDWNSNKIIHSYAYYQYLFSTVIVKQDDIWTVPTRSINTDDISIMALDNMQYPFSYMEKLWLYNKLRDTNASSRLLTHINKLLNQLTADEYTKLYSDIALIKLSE